MEQLMDQTAISYPYTTVTEMTGEMIKIILEDVCDNLFNPDPYYQQGGDMVRVGGLSYSCDPNAKMGARIGDMSLKGKPIEAGKHYKVAGWAPVAEAARTAGGEPIWDLMARYLPRSQGDQTAATRTSAPEGHGRECRQRLSTAHTRSPRQSAKAPRRTQSEIACRISGASPMAGMTRSSICGCCSRSFPTSSGRSCFRWPPCAMNSGTRTTRIAPCATACATAASSVGVMKVLKSKRDLHLAPRRLQLVSNNAEGHRPFRVARAVGKQDNGPVAHVDSYPFCYKCSFCDRPRQLRNAAGRLMSAVDKYCDSASR